MDDQTTYNKLFVPSLHLQEIQSTLIQCALLFLFVLVSSSIFAQANPKQIKEQADAFYENKKYKHALKSYQEYSKYKGNDTDVLLATAICLYETNDVASAKQLFTYLASDTKKVTPKVFLYLAKSFHAELDFQEAAKNYKLFLAKAKEGASERKSVRDAIRRCGNGLKLSYQAKPALVENLGDKVNSEYNDFAPVTSPNYSNKLYFSSARSSSIGGLRDNEGRRDNTLGKYSSDMYFTSISNGEWTATTPMSALLNTPRNDVILDFSADGSVLFFYKGYNLYSGEIFLDTFSKQEERMFSTPLKSPLIAEDGDGRPDFFRDSIVIFDSRRTGGYGGSDLYYMIHQRDGTWTAAQNLGPQVNSAYDETTPFVAADGNTLFFSSNDSRKSIGGMDIFKSSYDHEKRKWSVPTNIGMPLNSAADDLFFSLSKDGLQGYFSSDRKESIGGNDIFVAYFKEEQKEQILGGTGSLTFVDKPVLAKPSSIGESTPKEEVKIYEIEALYYTDDTDITAAANVHRLNALVRLLKENPELKTTLTCHADESDPSQFDLYFAVKRAEQAANYLVKNGIQAYRINMCGVGSSYPIAQNILNGAPNEMGRQLNRRIDIAVLNQTNPAIKVVVKEPQVSQFMKSKKAGLYKNKSKGLSYKIQIGALKQMYKGKLLKEHEHPLVERIASEPFYKYTIGWFKQHSQAQKMIKELNLKGQTDVFMVAYIDGRRISEGEALKFIGIYPDLVNFIGN